ncbi:hypothetical protein ABPG77_004939 [Micractinium sp. CCAP 211/92]
MAAPLPEDVRAAMMAVAEAGDCAAVQRLLAAHPAAAHATEGPNAPAPSWTALHAAAIEGHAGVCKLIVDINPQTALATGEDIDKQTPLHFAAEYGHAEAVRVLVAAAPEAAALPESFGFTPVWMTICEAHEAHFEAFGHLFMVGTTTEERLEMLAQWRYHDAGALAPLYARVVAAGRLSADQWARVPRPWPPVGRLLPAVLERSREEAGLLVQHLAPDQRAALRAAALSLSRAQARLRSKLPPELVAHILCHMFA